MYFDDFFSGILKKTAQADSRLSSPTDLYDSKKTNFNISQSLMAFMNKLQEEEKKEAPSALKNMDFSKRQGGGESLIILCKQLQTGYGDEVSGDGFSR